MKTVIQFVPLLSDGGAQTIIRSYSAMIDRNEIDFIVITLFPCYASANYKAVSEMGIKIYSLYPQDNMIYRGINKLLGIQITSRLLKRRIMTIQPCAIHIHMALLKYLAPIRDTLNDIRLFYTCHSLPEYFFSGINENERKAAKQLISDNNLQIIALHEKMADELNNLLDIDNTLVLKNGINIDAFTGVHESKTEIRKELGFPEDAFIIGHVGRFTKVKNHLFIIEIFKELLKYRNAHLVLVGDGELLGAVSERIKRLGIEDKVTILSHRRDVPKILKSLDIFLFPSLYEGLSVSLIEAQAAGLRCVISNTIPDVNRVLDSTVSLDLNSTPECWCKAILNQNLTQKATSSLKDYDIKAIVYSLQKMYLGQR